MQLDPAARLDEIKFWLAQDAEHNLFFALGLGTPQGEALRARADALYRAYSADLQTNTVDSLTHALTVLLPQAQVLKADLLTTLNAGQWIGWLYPAFVDHAKREMDYLSLRILPASPVSQGGLTPREEMCTINRFNADELGLASHLLDPSYDFVPGGPVLAARDKGAKAQALAASCYQASYPQLLADSRAQAGDTEQFFANTDVTKIKSIISPILAAHTLRERQRFVKTLDQLPSAE